MLLSASLAVVVVTETVAPVFEAVESFAGEGDVKAVTGADDSGTESLALVAWCRAARSRFFSRSAGPRCRGRGGG